MGWTWACLGGTRDRLPRLDSDGRVCSKSTLCALMCQGKHDDDAHVSVPLKSRSIGGTPRLKSAASDSSAYAQPFQHKPVVCGSLKGSKLFRRKAIRRPSSSGNCCYRTSAKRKSEDLGSSNDRVDRLQDEVDLLKRRLAEEEAEARKLRSESPRRKSCSSISRECTSPCSSKDDRPQRHWHTWLGLTLSPRSRTKLEDQLRLLAVEEMSKNEGKGLTNSQKALIVATRLWHCSDDAFHSSHASSDQRDSYSDTCSSCIGNSLDDHQDGDGKEPAGKGLSKGSRGEYLSSESVYADTTLHVASFRDSLDLKIISELNMGQETTKTTSSTCESDNFSFHPSSKGADREEEPAVESAATPDSAHEPVSCDEQGNQDEEESYSGEEPLRPKTPRTSFSQREMPVPDDEARRFIDLRYHELEDKVKSPNRPSVSSPSATPDHNLSLPLRQHLLLPDCDLDLDVSSSESSDRPMESTSPSSADASPDEGLANLPLTTALNNNKSFFSARTGRIWQPLSPVKEVDSAQSSVLSSLDTDNTLCPEKLHPVSATAEGGASRSSHGLSTSTSAVSRSELDGGDERKVVESSDGSGFLHEDDLFTLSPRRLNRDYDPWNDANFQSSDVCSTELDASVESGTTTDWNTSEDSDVDIQPIQCQSPDLIPKPLRSKYAKPNIELKVEYARDKYLKEMGLPVDELLMSTDFASRLGVTKPISTPAPLLHAGKPFYSDELPLVSTVESKKYQPSSNGSLTDDLTGLARIANLAAASNSKLSELSSHEVMNTATASASEPSAHPISSFPDDGKVNVTVSVGRSSEGVFGVDMKGSSTESLQTSEDHELNNLKTQQEEKGNPFYFDIAEHHHGDIFWNIPAGNLIMPNESTPGYPVASEFGKPECQESQDECNLQMKIDTHEEVTSPDSRGLDAFSSAKLLSQRDSTLGDPYESGLDAFSSTKLLSQPDSTSGDLYQYKATEEERVSYPRKLHELNVRESGGLRSPLGRSQLDQLKVLGSNGHQVHDTAMVSGTGFEENGSLRESCCSNEVFQSPRISKDLGFSTRREPADSHELNFNPEMRERSTRFLSSNTSESAVEVGVNCDSFVADDGIPANKSGGSLSKSPEERPILGTVAAWWANEKHSYSHHWWDGQGIPNSTSKYKEDQKVNWHSTPFEARIEQALATQTAVPSSDLIKRNFATGEADFHSESVDVQSVAVM